MPCHQVAAQPPVTASPVYACHGNMSSAPGPCPACGQPMQPLSHYVLAGGEQVAVPASARA